MTYGENAGIIRGELTALLQQHRIQQRLGGPGSHTMPQSTTVAEREELGRTIQRYRDVTLIWCGLALEAVSSKTDLRQATTLQRRPVEELRYRLHQSVDAESDGPSLLDLLAVNHRFDLLRSWQGIGRAAALGEHDFTADVNLGHLTSAEARTVARDAAGVIRGVLVLDRRYKSIPGWRHVTASGRLNRAAEQVSRSSGDEPLDPSVDSRGWHPAATAIVGSAMPGVAGAVQAQHNLLVDLAHFPNALSLRRLLHAQVVVSHEAARHASAAAPDLVDRFHEREQVYATLVRETRNVGGLIGGGGVAVTEGINAAGRLQRSPIRVDEKDQMPLRELTRLFIRTDARLASIIERGLQEKLYFLSVTDPWMTNQHLNGVYQPHKRWMAVPTGQPSDLMPLVRDRLRPGLPVTPPSSPSVTEIREAYQMLVAQRPFESRNRDVPR